MSVAYVQSVESKASCARQLRGRNPLRHTLRRAKIAALLRVLTARGVAKWKAAGSQLPTRERWLQLRSEAMAVRYPHLAVLIRDPDPWANYEAKMLAWDGEGELPAPREVIDAYTEHIHDVYKSACGSSLPELFKVYFERERAVIKIIE